MCCVDVFEQIFATNEIFSWLAKHALYGSTRFGFVLPEAYNHVTRRTAQVISFAEAFVRIISVAVVVGSCVISIVGVAPIVPSTIHTLFDARVARLDSA